jgi:hypothetical protein
MAAWEWPRQGREVAAVVQPSKLVSGLFRDVEEGQRLMVLHIGAASPETMDFFAGYRCRLFLNDLFQQLPFALDEEEGEELLAARFERELQIPGDVRFDICLFWDFFNYLDADGIAAFLSVLRPHLHAGSVAHAYAVHNLRAPRVNQRYGVVDHDAICVRPRDKPLAGYSPRPQNELKTLLDCFRVDRSVLLTDSRLELLLHTRPAAVGR